jgi:hypothetical protein
VIKVVLVGAWACFVTLAAGAAMNHFRANPADTPAQAMGKIETKKTKEINVPKLKNGVVRGYVIAQLAYSFDSAKLGGKSELVDLALVDEVFKYLFPDENVDVDQIEKFDAKRMTQTMLANVNKRIGVDAVTDVGMQEFVFEQINDAAQKNDSAGGRGGAAPQNAGPPNPPPTPSKTP